MGSLVKFILIAALGYGIYVILFGTPDLKAPAQVEIPKGAGVSDIAAKLKDAEVIRSKFGFETLVWLMRASSKLQAGDYKFEAKDFSLADIVRMLTSGLGAMNEREITVIEGWGVDDIGGYLEKEGIGTKREFFEHIKSEGYLFPDTYRVRKDATQKEVVQKMLDNFDKKVTEEMRRDIAEQGKDIFDIVRMASIIEAEVPHEEDRAVISGILWKRLDIGMALQADSTLNYAIGGTRAALTFAQLKIDSPYNTYKYRGLPPGPIGNPGLSAIRAAIYPRHTAYLYFLSGKDGKTYFAKTLEEHNENKAKYLL